MGGTTRLHEATETSSTQRIPNRVGPSGKGSRVDNESTYLNPAFSYLPGTAVERNGKGSGSGVPELKVVCNRQRLRFAVCGLRIAAKKP